MFKHQPVWLRRQLHRIHKSIALTLVALLLSNMIAPIAYASTGQGHAAQTTTDGNCEAPERIDPNAPKGIFLPLVQFFTGTRGAEVQVDNSVALIQSAPEMRVLNYEVGKVYSYLYDYEITTQNMSRDKEATRMESPATSRVNSYADITILSKSADGTVEAQLVMRAPFLCSVIDAGEQIVAQDQKFLDELATPLRFKQNAQGIITEVMSQPDLSLTATNVQKGILNFVQITLQEGADYTVMETGGQGQYNANYKVEDKADGIHIVKSIVTADYQTLNTAGERPESLQLSTALNMVIGKERGVLTSVNVVEDHMSADGTEDPANTDAAQGADGLSVWSSAKTAGSLELQDVTDAPAGTRAAAEANLSLYAVDTIGGEFEGDYNNDKRIDLATIDLDAEFATLEAEPDSATHYMRILDLHAADEGTVVVDKIGTRLPEVLDNPAVSLLYIDILGSIGTPQAQEYLNGFFGNANLRSANISASTTITAQQQVLINMVTLTQPVTQTISTLRQISSDDESELQPAAATVLGGLADTIDEYDPDLEDEILYEIEEELYNATTVDDVLLYLDVLGNIGDELSVELIVLFITDTIYLDDVLVTDTIDIEDINITAYEALRGIPGEEAEIILTDALWNEDLEPWMRDIIAELLIDRDFDDETILTVEGAELLDEYIDLYLDFWDDDYDDDEDPEEPRSLDQANGLVRARTPDGVEAAFSRNWGKNFGNRYVGVRLPGSLYAATPPQSNQFGGGLYVRASQRVDAYVWQVLPNLNVASASAESRYNGATGYNINVNVSMLNNRLRLVNQNRFISCTQNIGPVTLLNKFQPILDKSVTIFVLGIIPISFGIKAGGSIQLTVDASTNNVCAGDFKAIRLRITPSIAITIIGEAYVNLLFAQGGAALRGDLVRVGLPTQGYVEFTTSTGVQRWCVNVDISVQPFSIRFYLFARARWNLFSNKWPLNKEWTVAQYGAPSYSYPLVGVCQNGRRAPEADLSAASSGVNDQFNLIPMSGPVFQH
ncbi:MAG: hypothetical protein AB8G95_14190 [Anaerolineae bacterium]